MNPDTVLITGSGFSVPAHYPLVADLTKRAFGREWPTPATARLFKYVLAKTTEFVKAWQGGRAVNYEDVVFVLRQLQDQDEGEIENPMIAEFLDQAAEALSRSPRQVARDARSLRELVEKDVVEWLWPPEEGDLVGYPQSLLGRLYGRLRAVVSLNHDLLIERSAAAIHEVFADGFERSENGPVHWWADDFPDNRVQLIKLHGSVDWRRGTAPTIADRTRSSVVTSRGELIDASRVAREQGIEIGDPAILCGTFNKTLDYHSGIFLDLYWRFIAAMRDSRRAIVVGYGFTDKAVNSAIIRWMNASSSRRLFIRDIDTGRLLEQARNAARREATAWVEDGRAVLDEGCASRLQGAPALAAFLAE